MKPLSKISILIISILFVSFTVKKSFAQESKDAQRAQWIFNISYGITWENEADITTYTIGVFSSESLFKELQKQAKTKLFKGKPVKVVLYTNYNDIKANNIIYVSRNENAYLGFVYQKMKGKNVLIMSDRSKQPAYSIINFREVGTKNPKPFDINAKLAAQNNIILSRTLIRTGGSRQDIQRMYTSTNKKFLEEQKKLYKKKNEIDSLKQRILLLEKENKQLQMQLNQNSKNK